MTRTPTPPFYQQRSTSNEAGAGSKELTLKPLDETKTDTEAWAIIRNHFMSLPSQESSLWTSAKEMGAEVSSIIAWSQPSPGILCVLLWIPDQALPALVVGPPPPGSSCYSVPLNAMHHKVPSPPPPIKLALKNDA